MTVDISYSLAQFHETARFIWENNPSVRNWPTQPKSVFDVMSNIQRMMRQTAMKNAELIKRERKLGLKLDSEWTTYSGTGGYYFLYELQSDDDEEDITIGVTILADMAVGHPDSSSYVTESIDNNVDLP